MRGVNSGLLAVIMLAVLFAAGCNSKPAGPPIGATVDPKLVADELGTLAGTWVYERQVVGGREIPIAELRQDTIVVTGNSLVRSLAGGDGQRVKPVRSTISVDPTASPKLMDDDADVGFRISRRLGIYKLEGDTLTICYDNKGAQRPTAFDSPEGSSIVLTVLRRQRK